MALHLERPTGPGWFDSLESAAVSTQAEAEQRRGKDQQKNAGQSLSYLRCSAAQPFPKPAAELRRHKRLSTDEHGHDDHRQPDKTDGQSDGELIDAHAESKGNRAPASSTPHIIEVDRAALTKHQQSHDCQHRDGHILRGVAHSALDRRADDEAEQGHGHLKCGEDHAEAKTRLAIKARHPHCRGHREGVKRQRHNQSHDLERHVAIVSIRHRPDEQGQETLQTIIVVAFVLLPILISILTFGSLIHVYIGSQAAAAAGARAAGTGGGFGPDQLQRVDEELRANGIDPAGCTVTASAAVVLLDQPISVTVRCPQHVGIPFLFERDVDLTSTFVARGEVNR
jgi:hypothetical protein